MPKGKKGAATGPADVGPGNSPATSYGVGDEASSSPEDKLLLKILALAEGMPKMQEQQEEMLRLLRNEKTKERYTVAEVAEQLGRSAFTVRRYISDGRLPATRLEGSGPNGMWLVSRDSLMSLLHKKHPPASSGSTTDVA